MRNASDTLEGLEDLFANKVGLSSSHKSEVHTLANSLTGMNDNCEGHNLMNNLADGDNHESSGKGLRSFLLEGGSGSGLNHLFGVNDDSKVNGQFSSPRVGKNSATNSYNHAAIFNHSIGNELALVGEHIQPLAAEYQSTHLGVGQEELGQGTEIVVRDSEVNDEFGKELNNVVSFHLN